MNYFALLILPLGLGCAAPAPSAVETWEQQIRAAEERHRTAFLDNDDAALDAMFAEDFIVNSPQNRVVEKSELLGMVKRGVLTISTFEQDIESIRRFGDIVVVMGEDRVIYAPPSPNAGHTHQRRFTDLWQLRGSAWSFVARQASIVTR